MRSSLFPRGALALAGVLTVAIALAPSAAHADEGWVITSFDATYAINPDGTVDTTEDIRVDFGTQQHHGIFRDIPIEYAYDDANNRLIRLTGIRVDDGTAPQQLDVSDNGTNLRIRIGDPNVFVTGPQRYRIQYTINRGLNPFPGHDEFYWNVTGNDWPVRIAATSARVAVPALGIQRVACYQGSTGSTLACDSSISNASSAQVANGHLDEAEGLTIVVGLERGLVTVEPPELVDANETAAEQVSNFLGLHPWTIAAAFLLGVVLLALVLRQWWIAGRDRWYGDLAHAGGAPVARRKPFFAHETIVTQFTPPDVDGSSPPRRLHPAEIGLPRSPEETRNIYRIAGGVITGFGIALTFLFGTVGAAMLAVPLLLAGILLMVIAPTMPRRTADGRELYRRSLGFRTYIERAETERQAFAERAKLFEEYLPYAIVYDCVDKWAKAFEGLGDQATQPEWYQGRGTFVASAFVSSVNDFSESISSVMASTPGGSGGSGFGGGGSSGGGGGGGGGGAW